jgi:uncharacterized membrane protein YdbT with pleckstrin-like domain
VVPAESAFSGFGHPAVITVALVLLISRGLQEAGMVSLAGNVISRLTLSQNQYMIMIMIVAGFFVFVYEQYRSHGFVATYYLISMSKNGMESFKISYALSFC